MSPYSAFCPNAPVKWTVAFPTSTPTYKLSCFKHVVFTALLTETLAYIEHSLFQKCFLTKTNCGPPTISNFSFNYIYVCSCLEIPLSFSTQHSAWSMGTEYMFAICMSVSSSWVFLIAKSRYIKLLSFQKCDRPNIL